MRRIIRHAAAGLGVTAVGAALVVTTWTGTSATTDVRADQPAVTVVTPSAGPALAGRSDQGVVSRGAQRPSLTNPRADILKVQQEKVAVREAQLAKERAAKLAAQKKAAAKKAAAKKAAAKTAAAQKKAAAAEARAKSLGYEPGTTDPKSIAKQIMVNRYGWGANQFSCYDNIIMRESMWDTYAENPGSGAYGIPQALPASKLAKFGSDWRTNPATQIRWGLDYVKDRYGTPCSAWGFKSANGWY